MLKLPHNCTHFTSQQSNAQNSPNQASTVHELRSFRCSTWIYKRQKNQRLNCQHPLDRRKGREYQENIYSALLTRPKPLTVWIKIQFSSVAQSCPTLCNPMDCSTPGLPVHHQNKPWKILKEMGIPDHLTCLLRNLYTGQEASARTGHRTTYWFQAGKGVHQGCILSPAYLTHMQSTS